MGKGRVLVTGAAGFIGFHLICQLLRAGYHVVGLDNLNDYYDVQLKKDRLSRLTDLGLTDFEILDIVDQNALERLFQKHEFEIVIHLAAQAGVRYSLTNPQVYVESNLIGFVNLLNCLKNHKPRHFIYASTSSVYGANTNYPFTEAEATDCPMSFYAATKKANEVMAYSYANLYGIPMTGLRFFTVYGPWGRPDMALFTFTRKILNDEPIQIFNHGELYRDFTFVNDIVDGLLKIMPVSPSAEICHDIYNIGLGEPVKLTDFIDELELQLGKPANRVYLGMQPGDLYKTFADTTKLREKFNYHPKTSLKEGITHFLDWYHSYYPQ